MTVRITLDEADFRTLVAGGIVRLDGYGAWVETVEIALSDIGWAAMRSAIHDAMRDAMRAAVHSALRTIEDEPG